MTGGGGEGKGGAGKLPMTFIECEEKLLKFVAQQGDSSTLQPAPPAPAPCMLYPAPLHYPRPPSLPYPFPRRQWSEQVNLSDSCLWRQQREVPAVLSQVCVDFHFLSLLSCLPPLG